jgi:hypothetical protein
MSMSPEQNRKKADALTESQAHADRNVTGDPARRFMSKSEMQAKEMVQDAEKQGLHMEIE